MSKNITTGSVTKENVQAFSLPWRDVNWGVWVNGVLVAIFQAQEEENGILAVHANVSRRALHPILTKAYALMFANDLLRYGAPSLVAEIPETNRAALRIARAAGFIETERKEGYVVLRRGHGES